MWKSRKYIGKHEMPDEESEPEETTLLICPHCAKGHILIEDNMGTCADCGNHMDIEDFYAEADMTLTTNLLGQKVLVYNVLV